MPELSPICSRLVVRPAASTLGIWRRRCNNESQNCRSNGRRFQRVPLIVVWNVYVRSADVLWPAVRRRKLVSNSDALNTRIRVIAVTPAISIGESARRAVGRATSVSAACEAQAGTRPKVIR